jgi:hypothetical protein
MSAVVAAVVILNRLRYAAFGQPATNRSPLPPRAKKLAAALLFSWWVALLSGRLLAYHDIANVERTSAIAVAVVSALMLAGFYLVRGRKRRAAGARSPQSVTT